jgi:hypothetical protein
LSVTFSPSLRRHWPLAIILALYLAAGSFYAVSAPFLDVSDEVRHYAMAERLARGGGLTVQDPALNAQITAEERLALRPLTYEAQEGSQPPLYYALMALVALPFDRSDWQDRVWPNPHAMLGRADATNNWNQLQHTPAGRFPWQRTALAVMVMRFIGVLLGAVVVACAYFIAIEIKILNSEFLILNSEFLPPLAAALVAFNPMFVHIMASVNNDTLATAASSLALMIGARMIVRGATVKQGVLLGIVLGVAALTKASGLALPVVVPFFVLIAELMKVRRGESEKVGKGDSPSHLPTFPLSHFLTLAAAMLLPMALIAGWWYARNLLLYGDPTGTTMMAQIAGPRDRIPTPLELIGEWDGFFKAYWGLFGAVNIPMHELVYIALEVMMILAGVGLVLVVWDLFRESEKVRREESEHLASHFLPFSPSPFLIFAMLFAAFAVAFIALVRWTSITLASQGRLLFPVIVPISIFTALGLLRTLVALAALVKRPVTQWVAPALMVALAALTLLAPFVYIAPAYALPAKLKDDSQVPANTQFTQLYFEDKIRWIGYTVNTPAQRVRPGEVLDVTLYWQALAPMDRNYSAFIRVLGRDDAPVHVLNTYPGGGMAQTTLWQAGDVIADRYRLRIDDTVTNTQLMPTVLKLDVGFWDFTTKEFLKTFDGQGTPTGRQTYEAASMAVQTPLPANAAIENQRLEKARVANVNAAQAGKNITLTLDWIVEADVDRDYTTFVQLFDYTGQKLDPQADGRALNGAFPPRWWRKGDIVRGDQYVIELPQPLPAGQYLIKFGLYDKDNQRMPAFDGDQPVNDAAISVPLTVE